MPSSRCTAIPMVIETIRELSPASILDVGTGFGKWGVLFREYTDILASESDPPRYQRDNWKVRIDGIEGFQNYLTDLHRYVYNTVHVGDMRQVISGLPTYDVIYLGDVIEHIDKPEGLQFLEECLRHAGKAVLVVTPADNPPQGSICGKELENHRSCWTADDFRPIDNAHVVLAAWNEILAVVLKPGIPVPECIRFAKMSRLERRWRRMKRMVGRRIGLVT